MALSLSYIMGYPLISFKSNNYGFNFKLYYGVPLNFIQIQQLWL